jgi:hypothetical protein
MALGVWGIAFLEPDEKTKCEADCGSKIIIRGGASIWEVCQVEVTTTADSI